MHLKKMGEITDCMTILILLEILGVHPRTWNGMMVMLNQLETTEVTKSYLGKST